MAELASLLIGDPPRLWSELGFRIDEGAALVSGVQHQLGGELKGIRAWSLRGLPDDVAAIDGFAVDPAPPTSTVAVPAAAHPNGVIGLDHVVLLTPDLDRTITALEDVGLSLRRTRESATYGTPMKQAFFRLGEVILEVVGPLEASMGDKPPRFYGLAFTVSDLDATASFFGDRLRPAKEAVQPGRRIATLDKSAGSTVAIAFMSPEPA